MFLSGINWVSAKIRSIKFLLLLILINQGLNLKSEASDYSKAHRIIVSSDIGGTDPDDFQSMVHLFLYADTFDIEGIISSPFGNGRKDHILKVINEYEKDFPKISSYSSKYPSPDSLRKISKQGAIDTPGPIGIGHSSEGSDWIIDCARRDDPRPLNILVWGGIEDLAQALHDAPDILPKLHVYWIGGPNKKWSVNAYQYIAENFPSLWIIEANATYRGWFTGGNQSGQWSNSGFVSTYIKGSGALGSYFISKKAEVKMGDTPSLMRLFHGTSDDPSLPSWGGQFVRAWERPHKVFNRLTTVLDSIEEFGVLELLLPFDSTTVANPVATLKIDRDIPGLVRNGIVKFLFSPKSATKYNYSVISNIPSLSNKTGSITSYSTPPSNKQKPSANYPNWWVDDPSPEYNEGGNIGAKTVNKWRVDFLTDFAKRLERCKFFANVYYKLNTIAENGNIQISPADTAYSFGSNVTLTAIPNVGYKFIKWEGDINETKTTIVVKMNSDKNITAKFEKITSSTEIKRKEVSVYPTSFNDFVMISNLEESDEPINFEMYDIAGKLVKKNTLLPEHNEMQLKLSSLLPGTYIVKISNGTVIFNSTLIKAQL